MDDGFNKYYRRRLVSEKTGTDLLNYLAIGFFASFVAAFVYVIVSPDCPFPFSYNEQDDFGLHDSYGTMCENAYVARMTAMAWIGFSILRVFFLVSRRQAGPMLKLSGLKVEKENGDPPTLGFAGRYALLEWLPLHILSLYVLLKIEVPTSLYALGSAGTFAVATQLIWLAPVIFKYRGKNIAELATGGRVVFTTKEAAKLEKNYQSKWKVKGTYIEFHSGNLVYALITFFFVFTSVQILRTPDLNPDYERQLYADREPVWENNVYFAMEGLTAPADVDDFYDYGRTKAALRFKDYETLKKLSRIPYTYEIPAEADSLPRMNEEQELKLSREDWIDLSCLYSLSAVSDMECAARQDFVSYIKANQIIWERFNNLPDYSIYRVPPQRLGGRIANPQYLAELKAVQIIELAENKEAEQAFLEWNRYWNLYRSMASAPESMIFKAGMAISIRIYMDAFEKLLYLQPELAKNHYAEITGALQPAGNAMFRTDKLLLDDISLVEPEFVALLGNANTVRNDIYNCIINFEKRAQLSINEYPFHQKFRICSPDNAITDSLFLYPLMQPGYFASNLIYSLVIDGLLKGTELVDSMKLWDVRLRMALLAVEILRQDVAVEDIPAFILSVSPELQNPVTEKPFEWDAHNKSIFFIGPGTDKKYEFRLNLE